MLGYSVQHKEKYRTGYKVYELSVCSLNDFFSSAFQRFPFFRSCQLVCLEESPDNRRHQKWGKVKTDGINGLRKHKNKLVGSRTVVDFFLREKMTNLSKMQVLKTSPKKINKTEKKKKGKQQDEQIHFYNTRRRANNKNCKNHFQISLSLHVSVAYSYYFTHAQT